MKNYSKLQAFVIALLFLVLISACNGQSAEESISEDAEAQSEDTEAQANSEEQTIVLGDISAAELLATVDIAIEQGYFEEEGINIERQVYSNGPNLMMAMANGEVDVAVKTGYTPILQAAAQGADIMIVASMAKNNAPVVARSDIESFEDLDGKVVGSPGLGTIQNTMLSLAEREYGIEFAEVIHAQVTDLPTFLERGEIDAFTSWEWVAGDAVTNLDDVHYLLEEPVVENAESVAMAVNNYVYEDKELMKKILRAYQKGIDYYFENQDEVTANIAERLGKSEEVIELALSNVVLDQPEIDVPSVKIAVEDAIETDRIPENLVPDIDEFLDKYIDTEIMLEAQE